MYLFLPFVLMFFCIIVLSAHYHNYPDEYLILSSFFPFFFLLFFFFLTSSSSLLFHLFFNFTFLFFSHTQTLLYSSCHKPIEKNKGCNHMTCSQCRHEFCWICMGPWRQHGSSTGVFTSSFCYYNIYISFLLLIIRDLLLLLSLIYIHLCILHSHSILSFFFLDSLSLNIPLSFIYFTSFTLSFSFFLSLFISLSICIFRRLLLLQPWCRHVCVDCKG